MLALLLCSSSLCSPPPGPLFVAMGRKVGAVCVFRDDSKTIRLDTAGSISSEIKPTRRDPSSHRNSSKNFVPGGFFVLLFGD